MVLKVVPPKDRDGFEIAIICALQSEADAVEALFDEYWDEDGDPYGKALGDTNAYTTGVIGRHNVVLAHMPGIGNGSAASVAARLRCSFRRIKLALVVGICGGVPTGTNGEEILLGDVIISTGIVQYDFGRQLPDRFVRKDTLEDSLGRPNTEIRAFLTKLGGFRGRKRIGSSTFGFLQELREKEDFQKGQYPGPSEDRLYERNYRHKHHILSACTTCAKCEKKEDEVCKTALESSCSDLKCSDSMLVQRQRLSRSTDPRKRAEESKPCIHFGLIASGNTVMKSGEDRDEIAVREKVIGFEMEGAGVWDEFPCVVIKGVCDYADSHKNKKWQGYAAGVAASCMKAFLKEWVPTIDPLSSTVVPACIASSQQDQALAQERTLNFLSEMDFKVVQDDIRKQHMPDTGQWLLETNEFKEWREGETPLLWCPGLAGSGKTVLTSIVVDHICPEFNSTNGEHSTNIGIAYVYCNYSRQTEQTALNLIGSIARQLVERDLSSDENSSLSHAQAFEKEHNTIAPRLEDYMALLFSITKRFQKTMIVIDALDECAVHLDSRLNRSVFIDSLRSLPELRLLITSRDLPEIAESLQGAVKLPIQPHDNDIMAYIESRIKDKGPLNHCITSELESDIKKTIKEKYSEIFILVRLLLDYIWTMDTVGDVRQALKTLPTTTDGFYGLSIKRIGNGYKPDRALKILAWILHAKRPLTVDELRHALAVQPKNTSITHHDEYLVREEVLVNCCAGLVRMTAESRIIAFSHPTVKEYLEMEKVQKELFGFNPDVEISRTCLTYLSYDVFDNSYLNGSKIEFQDYPLLKYAAFYWSRHARGEHEEQVAEMASDYLSQKSKLAFYYDIMKRIDKDDIKPKHRKHRINPPPTLIADRKRTLFSPPPPTAAGTPLMRTAHRKHTVPPPPPPPPPAAAAGVPLTRTAHRKRTIPGHSILGWMAGSPQIITSSSKPGQIGRRNWEKPVSGMCVAIYFELVEVAKNLIKRDPDVLSRMYHGKGPLHLAVHCSSRIMVIMLVDSGADIEQRDAEGRTAMHIAAEMCSRTMLRILLDKGADIEAKWKKDRSSNGETPLWVGAYERDKTVVELLLERGASVAGHPGAKAVHFAVSTVDKDLLSNLINAGASIKHKDCWGNTDLHEAAFRSPEIIKLMLAGGAEVDGKNYDGQTALHLATRFELEGAMEALLDAGADLEATNANGETALHIAVAEDYTSGVKRLLSAGANVSAKSKTRKTAMYYAVLLKSSGEIVELLLKAGAVPLSGEEMELAARDHMKLVSLNEANEEAKRQRTAQMKARGEFEKRKVQRSEACVVS